jgi:hypothetical protein
VADATVPRSRPDTLPLATESPRIAAVRAVPSLPISLTILWAAIVVGVALFLTFGSVRVGAGNWINRRFAVSEIWSRFLSYLAKEGASPALVLAVAAAALLTLLGAALLLWLAFGLRDELPPPPTDASGTG